MKVQTTSCRVSKPTARLTRCTRKLGLCQHPSSTLLSLPLQLPRPFAFLNLLRCSPLLLPPSALTIPLSSSRFAAMRYHPTPFPPLLLYNCPTLHPRGCSPTRPRLSLTSALPRAILLCPYIKPLLSVPSNPSEELFQETAFNNEFWGVHLPPCPSLSAHSRICLYLNFILQHLCWACWFFTKLYCVDHGWGANEESRTIAGAQGRLIYHNSSRIQLTEMPDREKPSSAPVLNRKSKTNPSSSCLWKQIQSPAPGPDSLHG